MLTPLANKINIDPAVIDRFMSKVAFEPFTDCWLWIGYCDCAGYGRFQNGYTATPAHRFSYEQAVGPIPPHRHAHHRCNTPACVNPQHLEILTPAEHVAKTVGHPKNKTHCKRGHEFTVENTCIYNGFRSCRACAVLRRARRNNPDYQSVAPQSKLYCKNGHPLFGENMTLFLTGGGYRTRLCKQCRVDRTNKYNKANREKVLAGKSARRASARSTAKAARDREVLSVIAAAGVNDPAALLAELQRLNQK